MDKKGQHGGRVVPETKVKKRQFLQKCELGDTEHSRQTSDAQTRLLMMTASDSTKTGVDCVHNGENKKWAKAVKELSW